MMVVGNLNELVHRRDKNAGGVQVHVFVYACKWDFVMKGTGAV